MNRAMYPFTACQKKKKNSSLTNHKHPASPYAPYLSLKPRPAMIKPKPKPKPPIKKSPPRTTVKLPNSQRVEGGSERRTVPNKRIWNDNRIERNGFWQLVNKRERTSEDG